MSSVTVQIGNSDDKLPQYRWANFVAETSKAIETYAKQVHFIGFSGGGASWQNAAFCFEIGGYETDELVEELRRIAATYNQESIAWLSGEVEFLEPIWTVKKDV